MVSFPSSLVGFWDFHPYMHLFSFRNLFVTCNIIICRTEWERRWSAVNVLRLPKHENKCTSAYQNTATSPKIYFETTPPVLNNTTIRHPCRQNHSTPPNVRTVHDILSVLITEEATTCVCFHKGKHFVTCNCYSQFLTTYCVQEKQLILVHAVTCLFLFSKLKDD